MGKYTHIVSSLPKWQDPEVNANYQQRIDLAKEAIVERGAAGLCDAYAKLRLEEAAAEQVLKGIHLRMTAYEQLMDATFEGEALSSIKLGSGISIRIDREPHMGLHALVMVDEDGDFVPVQSPEPGDDSPEATAFRVYYERAVAEGRIITGKEAHRRWCVANGYDREMTLPWGTSNSLMKEALLSGQPLPAGVRPFNRPKFVVTGLKKQQTAEGSSQTSASDEGDAGAEF